MMSNLPPDDNDMMTTSDLLRWGKRKTSLLEKISKNNVRTTQKGKDEKNQQSTFRQTKKSTITLQMTKKQNEKTINFAINTKKERWNRRPKNQQQQSTYLERSEKRSTKTKATINSGVTSRATSDQQLLRVQTWLCNNILKKIVRKNWWENDFFKNNNLPTWSKVKKEVQKQKQQSTPEWTSDKDSEQPPGPRWCVNLETLTVQQH